jgi:hypothetical protein
MNDSLKMKKSNSGHENSNLLSEKNAPRAWTADGTLQEKVSVFELIQPM